MRSYYTVFSLNFHSVDNCNKSESINILYKKKKLIIYDINYVS